MINVFLSALFKQPTDGNKVWGTRTICSFNDGVQRHALALGQAKS